MSTCSSHKIPDKNWGSGHEILTNNQEGLYCPRHAVDIPEQKVVVGKLVLERFVNNLVIPVIYRVTFETGDPGFVISGGMASATAADPKEVLSVK